MTGDPISASETSDRPGLRPRRGRLAWSLPLLFVAIFATGILHLAGRHVANDHEEHERCRRQAVDIVQQRACECMCRREDGLWRHMFIVLAPPSWRELWHRAIRNECLAEAYTRIVTERGVEAVRPLPMPGTAGGFSP